MSFFSTRGGSCVTASQAILRGLAPDGGLYVPAMFPTVAPAQVAALGQMPYPARARTGSYPSRATWFLPRCLAR